MEKLLKKLTAIFLVLVFCLGIGTSSVYASEVFDTTPVDTINVSVYEDIQETRSVPTAAVKKAIKWALRHSDDLVKSAARYIGKDAARVVERKLIKATPVLKTLLKYDTLVWKTVQDQLTHVVGRQAAIWIRMALEWLL